MKARVQPPALYFYVFGALLLLTGLTAGAAYVDLGLLNNVAALGIASVKAVLVGLYFMHLRDEAFLTWIFVIVSLLFLTILFGFGFSDYLTREWQNPPQGWESPS